MVSGGHLLRADRLENSLDPYITGGDTKALNYTHAIKRFVEKWFLDELRQKQNC